MYKPIFAALPLLLLIGCASQPYPPLPSNVPEYHSDTRGGAAISTRAAGDQSETVVDIGPGSSAERQGRAQAAARADSAPVPQEVVPPPPDPDRLPSAEKRQLDIRLASQRFQYFEDDQLVWSGPISAGTAEHPTPKGDYHGQSKDRNKRSGSYTNSFDQPTPMPYSLQFRGPYFVHEGYVTGRPESHGCVRLRHADARFVYERMRVGDRVVVAD
ncbi:L,D-transpeptidase [Halochromatium sp.]